jgi:colanic acid/amylovoran biosynthesis glycosyltransferase
VTGTLCIIGVDDNRVLKDFVRAHVEQLAGDKICVDHWYPDYRHQGRTIRYFHSTRPVRSKLRKLLPQFAYHRLVTQNEFSDAAIHDSLAGFFRDHRVDVILAEFGTTGADVARHAHALGIPLIVHFHGHDAHRSATVNEYRERYREMFRHAFRVVSVSHFMTRTLIELGADPDRITYNPYGPRSAFFDIQPSYEPTLLALGRFTDIKSNHLTIMAFAKALERVPDAKLVMVGDGELLESCRSIARTLGVGDRVTFAGAVPHKEVFPFFERACAFVQHSSTPTYGDAEGTPVAILEAGAAALPVVATRHAGIPDVVVEGTTGLLVDEGDITGMADRMVRLLSDPGLCRTMGGAARDHVRTNYSIERHIACLQEIIDAARAS